MVFAMLQNLEDVAHLAKSVAFETVVANDYNLSVSSYVEAKDTAKLSISLRPLNAELKKLHGQQNRPVAGQRY